MEQESLLTQSEPKGTLTPTPELRFEMSASIGTLIGALAKARKQFKPVVKTETNPFFKSKYADLANVIEATVDGLSDNGLAVLQPPAFEKPTGTVGILTLLAHSSGEWIKAILDMPVAKGDAQGVGSAITYGRRYSYSAVLNVASELDDDANAASGKKNKDLLHADETDEEFDQRTEGQTRLKLFEIKAIDEACKRTGKSEAEIIAYLELSGVKPPRIENLLRDDFKKFLQWANTTGKPNGKDVAAAILEKPKNPNVVKSYQHAWGTLWGRAKERSIPEADVKQYYRETYKVEHGNELTPFQFKEVAQWLETA